MGYRFYFRLTATSLFLCPFCVTHHASSHDLIEAHSMCLKAADYVNCYQYHLNTKSPQSDLRNYGPLKIDWSMWKSRGEKHIVPALNQDGKLLYVALNCTTRFINVKADTGKWKNWLMPKQPFEHRLIYDFCKNKSTP